MSHLDETKLQKVSRLGAKTETLPQFVRDYLASPPHRGDGLNFWFFKVARLLHCCRGQGEIIALLQAATYGEHIKVGEIERAVVRSKACAWQPGQPCVIPLPSPWPAFNPEKRRTVIQESGGAELADLWERSPVRLMDDRVWTEEIIDALFPGDLLLCCGKSKSDFATRTREEWRSKLSERAVIVPSPMTARSGHTQEGKQSAHALSITGTRRFLVIEFDQGDVDEHAALLLHLAENAPLALVVHSGSKSLHGWFACQDQGENRLRRFMEYAASLGADHAPWVRSQFVRMPDGTRENGQRQTVFYFDPETLQ